MDTRNGRVFGPDEMEAYRGLMARTDAEREAMLAECLVDQREMLEAAKDADEAGALVPISELAAQKLRLGERELARRERRRQARAAFKRNG